MRSLGDVEMLKVAVEESTRPTELSLVFPMPDGTPAAKKKAPTKVLISAKAKAYVVVEPPQKKKKKKRRAPFVKPKGVVIGAPTVPMTPEHELERRVLTSKMMIITLSRLPCQRRF